MPKLCPIWDKNLAEGVTHPERQELPKSIPPEILSINTTQDRPATLASFNRNSKP
jgi:hypothetical protein